jgi:hypothetical protein
MLILFKELLEINMLIDLTSAGALARARYSSLSYYWQ